MLKDKSLLIFIGWRISLSLVVILAVFGLPFRPSFAAWESLHLFGHRALTTWANFDGVHYLTIAQSGYRGTGLIQAFFPLYPLLIRYLSLGFINPVLMGVVISTTSFAVGLWLLLKLIRLDETFAVAQKTLVLLLAFPTAFYFTAVYNEGLFFLLIVLSFWFIRKKRWFWAGIMGALAAATRLVGIFLIPALVFEWFIDKRSVKNLFWCFFPGLGLLTFMTYLWRGFGDPLLFYHVQTAFGASRETGTLVLPPQVFWRYFRMLFTVPITNPAFYTVMSELAAAVIGFFVFLSGWRWIRTSYLLFALPAFILPMLTGNFSSLPRYILPLFPFFVLLAKLSSRKAFFGVCLVFAILQIVNLIFFTQGLWVA